MKSIKLLFIITLLTTILIGCSTTKNNVSAYVTINISTIDDQSVIGANVMLQNNTGNTSQVYSRIASSNIVSFPEVEYGTYTLVIDHKNYDTHINGNINIGQKEVSHNVILVPEGIDYMIFTIVNKTGKAIESLFIKNTWLTLWGNNLLTNILPNGSSHTVITLLNEYEWFTSEVAIRLVDVNNSTFTKYDVPYVAYGTVTFTANDLDGNEIKHYGDLIDPHRFDFFLYIGLDYVVVESFIEVEMLHLRINGAFIELTQRDFSEALYSWEGNFNFVYGQTYQMLINTMNPDHSFTANLAMVQNMILNFPETIGTGSIPLNWKFEPNNSLNPILQLFRIYAETSINYDWFYHEEFIAPSLRNYTVPAGFIPSPQIGWVDITVIPFNFSVSDRMSFFSREFWGRGYRDGILIENRTNTNIPNNPKALLGRIKE